MANISQIRNKDTLDLAHKNLLADLAEKFLQEAHEETQKNRMQNASKNLIARAANNVTRSVTTSLSKAKRALAKGEINKLLNKTAPKEQLDAFDRYVAERISEVDGTLREMADPANATKMATLSGFSNTFSGFSPKESQKIQDTLRSEYDKNMTPSIRNTVMNETAKLEGFLAYIDENAINGNLFYKEFEKKVKDKVKHGKTGYRDAVILGQGYAKVATSMGPMSNLKDLTSNLHDVIRYFDISANDIQKLYFEAKYKVPRDHVESILEEKLIIGQKEAKYMAATSLLEGDLSQVKQVSTKHGTKYQVQRNWKKIGTSVGKTAMKTALYGTVGFVAKTSLSWGYPIATAFASTAGLQIVDGFIKKGDNAEYIIMCVKELTSKIQPETTLGIDVTYNNNLKKLKSALDGGTLVSKPGILMDVIRDYPKDHLEDLYTLSKVSEEIMKVMKKKKTQATTMFMFVQNLKSTIDDKIGKNEIDDVKKKLKAESLKTGFSDADMNQKIFEFSLAKKSELATKALGNSSDVYAKTGRKVFLETALDKKKIAMRLGANLGIAGTTKLFSGAYSSLIGTTPNTGVIHTVSKTGRGIMEMPGQAMHSVSSSVSNMYHGATNAIGNMYDSAGNFIGKGGSHIFPSYMNMNPVEYANLHAPSFLSGTAANVTNGTLNFIGNFGDFEMNTEKWWAGDVLWGSVVKMDQMTGLSHSMQSIFGTTMEKGGDAMRWLYQEIYEDKLEPVMPEVIELATKIGLVMGVVGGTHRYLLNKNNPIKDIYGLTAGGAKKLAGLLGQAGNLMKKTGGKLTSPGMRKVGTWALIAGTLPLYVQLKGLQLGGKGLKKVVVGGGGLAGSAFSKIKNSVTGRSRQNAEMLKSQQAQIVAEHRALLDEMVDTKKELEQKTDIINKNDEDAKKNSELIKELNERIKKMEDAEKARVAAAAATTTTPPTPTP